MGTQLSTNSVATPKDFIQKRKDNCEWVINYIRKNKDAPPEYVKSSDIAYYHDRELNFICNHLLFNTQVVGLADRELKSCQLDMFKWISEQFDALLPANSPLNIRICYYAAMTANIDCLKYAHTRGYSMYLSANSYACGGSLACLKYAQEQGCKIDLNEHIAYFVSPANDSNLLECFKYLHNLGYKWNENDLLQMESQKLINCFKYLIDVGCPHSIITINRVIADDSVEFLKCLIDHDTQFTDVICRTICEYASTKCGTFAKSKGFDIFGADYNKYSHPSTTYSTSLHTLDTNSERDLMHLYEPTLTPQEIHGHLKYIKLHYEPKSKLLADLNKYIDSSRLASNVIHPRDYDLLANQLPSDDCAFREFDLQMHLNVEAYQNMDKVSKLSDIDDAPALIPHIDENITNSVEDDARATLIAECMDGVHEKDGKLCIDEATMDDSIHYLNINKP